MWIAGQLDVSHESFNKGLGAAAQVAGNDPGDFLHVERVNAVAREQDTISHMQGERLPREINQFQLLTSHGGAQQMPPRIGPRFLFAEPPLCRKLVEQRGQRMVLIEEGDFSIAVKIERAVADTDPLEALGSE